MIRLDIIASFDVLFFRCRTTTSTLFLKKKQQNCSSSRWIHHHNRTTTTTTTNVASITGDTKTTTTTTSSSSSSTSLFDKRRQQQQQQQPQQQTDNYYIERNKDGQQHQITIEERFIQWWNNSNSNSTNSPRDIVLHAIENGYFIPNEDYTDDTDADDDDDDIFYRGVDNNNNSSNNSPPSINDFNRIYSPTCEYHDLFIITKGRLATLYSFELISKFWDIKLIKDNEHKLISVFITKTTETKEEQKIIVRIPYRIQQKFKLILPKNLIQTEYSGWIDLHLQQILIEDYDNKSHSRSLQSSSTSSLSSFVIIRHDDRIDMELFSSSTTNNNNHNNNAATNIDKNFDKDILTTTTNIPMIGTCFQLFRRGHGIIVEFLATARRFRLLRRTRRR